MNSRWSWAFEVRQIKRRLASSAFSSAGEHLQLETNYACLKQENEWKAHAPELEIHCRVEKKNIHTQKLSSSGVLCYFRLEADCLTSFFPCTFLILWFWNDKQTGYHWDCSDWANQSQNPLPNITEVPGSEIPDSSSFHSNESNESNGNSNTHQLDPLHNGKALDVISPSWRWTHSQLHPFIYRLKQQIHWSICDGSNYLCRHISKASLTYIGVIFLFLRDDDDNQPRTRHRHVSRRSKSGSEYKRIQVAGFGLWHRYWNGIQQHQSVPVSPTPELWGNFSQQRLASVRFSCRLHTQQVLNISNLCILQM